MQSLFRKKKPSITKEALQAQAAEASAKNENAEKHSDPFIASAAGGKQETVGGKQPADETMSVSSQASTVTNVSNNSNQPPALQSRVMQKASSKNQLMDFDRYWRLSDVLEDSSIVISWKVRLLLAYDIALCLKQFHSYGIAHNRLHVDQILINQAITAKVQDGGALSKNSEDQKKDILFFGAILCQLALHQTLDLGATPPRRSVRASVTNFMSDAEKNNLQARPPGIPAEDFQNLSKLFALELAGADTTELQGDLSFQETLSQEVKKMIGFAPPASENVPPSAVASLQELGSQMLSVMPMNRPDADAVEDWMSAILDEVGGKQLTAEQMEEKRTIFATLERNELEVLGDSNLIEESPLFKNKGEMENSSASPSIADESNGAGYETDDSFQPPPKERRASRMSIFLDEAKEVKETTMQLRDHEEEDMSKKKKEKRRLSVIPSSNAVSNFMKKEKRKSLTGGLTPYNLKKKFDVQERLTEQEAMDLLKEAERVLSLDPNLPVLQAPCTVVGDLHGQYFDLIHMLDKYSPSGSKAAPSSNFLFLGDYVDRGDWSCEVLFYLLSLKIANPKTVTLIRGNHECDTVSSYFGFKEECERKYGRGVFLKSLSVFCAMPVGAILETGGAGRFLCVHGGISPNVTSLSQFEKMNRFEEPGMNGFLCDVLWSDPIKDDFDDNEHNKSLGDFLSIDYVTNPARGCSFRYGYSALVSFLATNRLVAIIRAHEVMQEGFRYHFQTITGGAQKRIMPPVITVFSAPNYLGKYGNKGAILKVDSALNRTGGKHQGFKPIDLLTPCQFEAVKHPEPLVLESELEKTSRRMENVLPYMPSSLEAFIKCAINLNDGVYDEGNEEVASPEPEKVRRKTLADEIAERTALAKLPDMESNLAGKISEIGKDVRMTHEGSPAEMQLADLNNLLPAANEKRRKSIDDLLKKGGVSSLVAKYQQAAAVDAINEMNPLLVANKMEEARKRLAQKTTKSDDEVPLFGGKDNGKNGGRSTLVQRKTEVGRKTVAEKKTQQQQKKKVEEHKEVQVEFSEEEIVCLQTLFLMVDRDGDDSINVKELMAWSAADGTPVGESYAKLTIEVLDFDKDGHIGFQDYLNFAAILKDYHRRTTAMQQQQQQKSG